MKYFIPLLIFAAFSISSHLDQENEYETAPLLPIKRSYLYAPTLDKERRDAITQWLLKNSSAQMPSKKFMRNLTQADLPVTQEKINLKHLRAAYKIIMESDYPLNWEIVRTYCWGINIRSDEDPTLEEDGFTYSHNVSIVMKTLLKDIPHNYYDIFSDLYGSEVLTEQIDIYKKQKQKGCFNSLKSLLKNCCCFF